MNKFLHTLEEALEAPELPDEDKWKSRYQDDNNIIQITAAFKEEDAGSDSVEYSYWGIFNYISKYGGISGMVRTYQYPEFSYDDADDTQDTGQQYDAWISHKKEEGNTIMSFMATVPDNTFNAFWMGEADLGDTTIITDIEPKFEIFIGF